MEEGSDLVIGKISLDKLDDMVIKLMRDMKVNDPHEAVWLVNSGRYVGIIKQVVEGYCWREENGIIYLSVTSDGTTGPEWIKRFKDKGFKHFSIIEDVLCSDEFKPTSGVTTEVAILTGEALGNNKPTIKDFREFAIEHKMEIPNPEIACLLCEKLTDDDLKAMGLFWLHAVHNPIKDSEGRPLFLNVSTLSGGGRCLSAHVYLPNDKQSSSNGFAFTVSQVS